MRNNPDLKFAFSRRYRLDPLLLDRSETATTPTRSGCAATSATSCPAMSSASTRWPATSPTRLAELRHEIGIDIIAWECDYRTRTASGPMPPKGARRAERRRRLGLRHRQDHLGELLPVLQLGSLRAHPERAGRRRRSARPRPPTSTPRSARGRSGRDCSTPSSSPRPEPCSPRSDLVVEVVAATGSGVQARQPFRSACGARQSSRATRPETG